MEKIESPGAHGTLVALAFASIGVVYGDIGTSPLYALRECFHGPHALPVDTASVLGVLSLIFWSLVLTVTLKYHVLVLHMDNRGEGGILALLTLVLPTTRSERKVERSLLLLLGLFGAALLYGDGMITPAISVLSAIEGLAIAAPATGGYVVPITILILVGLFLMQSRGTAGLSRLFSPVITVWFLALALMGAMHLGDDPTVLRAIDPSYAMGFVGKHGFESVVFLGSVFLVVTGGEALYADMGHFGRGPIDLAWFTLVGPSLVLHYFGQGAMLLAHPERADNPFYRMVPEALLYPLVALATLATVIASQAVISGAFSLTRQAVQLGYYPRVEIIHTSSTRVGQIYIPSVNWALMVATVALVLTFGSSSSLTGAYGVAVSITMVITTVLAWVVMRRVWGWHPVPAGAVAFAMLATDLAFLFSNLTKVWLGGWVPMLAGAAVYLTMSTWHRGREILAQRIRSRSMPLKDLVARITAGAYQRVAGTAIYMVGDPTGAPLPLLRNLEHNKVLHERIVLLNIATDEGRAHVPPAERVQVERVAPQVWAIRALYGYMDSPSAREVLEWACTRGFSYDRADTTFFVGRESVYATDLPGMALWRERLFAVMARNATRATDYFDVPQERIFEVGTPIPL